MKGHRKHVTVMGMANKQNGNKIHFDQIKVHRKHETVMANKQNGNKIHFDEIKGHRKHETVMANKQNGNKIHFS